ncbi:hypothetical protein S1OALGB6SA_2269, partial [Olavius algarvensis spirochete endosymbiont]|uniref:hypothetical protein n=1 Tax=Olavius algarvensis spirochete endosymbiont TaxID=260710 RepID=UPI000F199981
PATSRWISPDPAGFELINPQKNEVFIISGTNWYSYTENNPVKYNDPNGGVPVLAVTAVFGGLAGGAMGAATGMASAVLQGNTSPSEIIGGAVGGAICGAVTGALIGSGVGIPLVAGGSFLGGAAGSMTENMIAQGPENLDAGTVAKDAAIDGGISAIASLLPFAMKGKTLSPLIKKELITDKVVIEGLGGLLADFLQDKVNPPSSSDLGGEGIDGSRTGYDSAQDNVNPQQSDRKLPIVDYPPSHWPKDESNDD